MTAVCKVDSPSLRHFFVPSSSANHGEVVFRRRITSLSFIFVQVLLLFVFILVEKKKPFELPQYESFPSSEYYIAVGLLGPSHAHLVHSLVPTCSLWDIKDHRYVF